MSMDSWLVSSLEVDLHLWLQMDKSMAQKKKYYLVESEVAAQGHVEAITSAIAKKP